MAAIPETHKDILETSRRAFAHLATLNADGTPQVTPIWFDYDGTDIIFNTARGRVKDRNLGRNPRVALSIQDPENGYRYLQIQGDVVDVSEEGADAMIDRLAQKYLGQEKYPWANPAEKRVTYRVRPSRVQTMG